MISTITWFVEGRKNYTGPRINLDNLANGETVGIPGTGIDSYASGTNGHAKDPLPAQDNSRYLDENDLPAGVFGRGELEDQVYDSRKRVNRNRSKRL